MKRRNNKRAQGQEPSAAAAVQPEVVTFPAQQFLIFAIEGAAGPKTVRRENGPVAIAETVEQPATIWLAKFGDLSEVPKIIARAATSHPFYVLVRVDNPSTLARSLVEGFGALAARSIEVVPQ